MLERRRALVTRNSLIAGLKGFLVFLVFCVFELPRKEFEIRSISGTK
jgi:hypothetical protein